MISIEWVLGGLYALILGSYGYIYRSTSVIWSEINRIKSNELHVIHDRLDKLEALADPPKPPRRADINRA